MSSNTKFLIYKCSGGLAHNLMGLSSAIKISNMLNRELIIDAHNHGAFGVNFFRIFSIKGSKKYYDSYDILPLDITYKGKSLKEIISARFCLKGSSYYLFDENISQISEDNSNHIMFYASCGGTTFDKNIQVNDEIIKMLNNEEHIKNKYISLHFRNTDLKNDIDVFIKKIKEINKYDPIYTIYLASDYSDAYDILKNKLPTHNIIRKTVPERGIHNLHYSHKNKFKQLYDSIVDIYYISKSNYFIPSYNSGFSRLIIDLINGKNLIIPNIKSNTIIIK